MKQAIHPEFNSQSKVTCACGNTFMVGSTIPEIRVEICAKCHPFYTGTQKFVDTLGQVERFQRKAKESEQKAEVKKQIVAQRKAKITSASDKPSLKDLLMQARKNLNS